MYGTNFVERVDFLLKERGESRAIMANALGFAIQNYVDWKRRNNTPSVELVFSIAKYLGVSVNYLILGKDNDYDDDILSAMNLLKSLPKEKRAPIMSIIAGQVEYWKNV